MIARTQDVSLDKLSDCETIADVRKAIDHPVSTSCRSPRNPLERELMSRLRVAPGVNACLLATAPTARLARFSCIDLEMKGTREVSCFTIMDARAVTRFRPQFDAKRTYDYKQAAANCPGTNHDAAEAALSLFPQTLSPIAKPEFGFVVGLGDARVPLGLAYHGFALVNPALLSDSAAIEIFDMFRNPTAAPASPFGGVDSTETIGRWTFSVHDEMMATKELAQNIERQSGLRVGMKARIVELTLVRAADTPVRSRTNDLENWQEAIVDDLKDRGFRSLSRAEMAQMRLPNGNDLREQLIGRVPYSQRGFLEHSLGQPIFLIDDSDDRCSKVTTIVIGLPEDGVKNDYGGMMFSTTAVGACVRAGGPDRVSSDLLGRETKILQDAMIR